MQSSTRHSSIKSRSNRRTSTGAPGRSTSFGSMMKDLDKMSPSHVQRTLLDYDAEFPGWPSDFPDVPDYVVDPYKGPSQFGGDAHLNASYHDGLAPTQRAAVPGAGTLIQQSWGGIKELEDDVANQTIYPIPQAMHLQNQVAYYPGPHHYVAPIHQQSHRTGTPVLNAVSLPQYKAEGIYVPTTSRLRKRSSADSDPDLEDAAIRHKKARRRPRDSSYASSSHTSRSTNDGLISDSDISDVGERKRLKKSREVKIRASGGVEFLYEKPKLDQKKDWVRINTTTKGMTTRTAKINHYEAEYEERKHPVGDWHGTKFFHQYTKDGEFLNKQGRFMSAEKIKEFILEYPNRNPKYPGAKLKLWIQRGPTDCARRYKSATWAKCRFKECPAHKYQTGTILHGHYRVSFDEKWNRDRENVDPFLTAGYVHLYCLERFLDFSEICRKADVEVDTRQLTNEPRGKWAATLANHPECAIAQKFVSAASRRHGLDRLPEFARYPKHDEDKIIRNGKTTYHKTTLTYRMHKCKESSRSPAQQEQFRRRGLGNTLISKHLGDLEMLFKASNDRKNKNRVIKKQKKSGTYVQDNEDNQNDEDDDDDDDDDEPVVAPGRSRRPIRRINTAQHTKEPDSDEDVEADDEPEVAPGPSRRPIRRTTRPQRTKEPDLAPDSDEDGEVENDSDEEALFVRGTRQPQPQPQPQPVQLPVDLTPQQIKVLYAQVMAQEQAAQARCTRQHSKDGQFANINPSLTEQVARDDAIDPTLESSITISPKSNTRLGSLIGTYFDPEVDQIFDFEDLDAFKQILGEEELQRRRSRLSMSKSIMKKPSSPGISKRTSRSGSRRVSIGRTTTREFFKTQSPLTVSCEGRRHSERLQNKRVK